MKFIISMGLLISTLSFAGVKRGIRYNSFIVTPTAQADVSFEVAKTIQTDGCNTYGMEATLNPVYSEGPVDTFILSYGIVQTELACDQMPVPAKKTVRSNKIKISYDHDTMAGITILIPADVRVHFGE